MGFSTQLLLWSLFVGVVVGLVIEPFWRGNRPARSVTAVFGVQALFTLAWAASLGFFGLAHLAYLLVTVVPAVVLATAVLSPSGRSWLRRGRRPLVGVALGLPPLLGLYATHVEPFWLRVDRVDVVSDAGAGIRIGVLADLQSRDIGDHERDAVASLIAQNPELVVIPGDLWQTDDDVIAAEWPRWADLIGELVDAVGPVVIIEGNTDHIGWIELIAERSGAIVVHDRVEAFDVDGTRVVIGGTRDLPGRPPPSTMAALEELVQAETDDVVTIALSHRPDVVEWIPGEVDLVVAGHTHGGQVRIPFFGPPITATDVPRDVAAGGLHDLEGQLIYVSTGVGLERSDGPQVRFGVRPSIGVLDLVAPSRSTE